MAIKELLNNGIIGSYWLADTADTLATVLMVVGAALIIILSYLLGSINFAIIISSKEYKQDIRNFGSKNAGMTNMMRTYGKKAAALTLVGDALKAAVACLAGRIILGDVGSYIAGLFCVVGHIFPIFYKFRGGKGVVTTAVAILMCNPIVFAFLLLFFIIIVAFTRYISLGSVVCVMLYPIILDRISRWLLGQPAPFIYMMCSMLITVLVVFKHWENIKRLFQGKENKFSFKKSVKSPGADDGNSSEEK